VVGGAFQGREPRFRRTGEQSCPARVGCRPTQSSQHRAPESV